MLQTETGFRAIFRLTDITQSVIRSFGIPSHVVADPVFVLTGQDRSEINGWRQRGKLIRHGNADGIADSKRAAVCSVADCVFNTFL